ncbi:MAG: DegV family EDD domain-containing protein [Proteobacteria bacterium]|nr:DegV family EDD domain-containing protein [Pseudomonadota bacterium]
MNPRRFLARAFLAGAADLRRRARLLDRINVFPVIDADTGVNMTQTLVSSISRIENYGDGDSAQLSQLLGRSLLKDARGNSGVIFSQFLVAFFNTLDEMGQLTDDSVAAAVARGRDLAYRAVAKPVEGTILTVIKELAQILNEMDGIDSLDKHAELQQRLSESVARTPELMPRLKNAGVVDAGALGFYIFASGLTLVLPALKDTESTLARIEARISGKDEASLGEIADTISPSFLESASKDKLSHRYCIDMLIDLPCDLPENWTASFEKIGSSVDAAQSGRLLKIHVHGNDARVARSAGRELGNVLEFSVEDMTDALVRRESSNLEDISRQSLRVVSDSSMSLSNETARELGIYRIENYVNVHDRMVRDADLDREELFSRMKEGHVYTTAQTSSEEVRTFFNKMLSTSEHLIYVAVGRAYTGTQELVRKVVSEHPEQGRIAVVDTHAASGQQGLICLAAARYAQGKCDFRDIIKYINNQVATCCEYLVIDNMKYLSRTGRIGKIKAAFASVLSVKPIVGHGEDGAIIHTKVRSHEAAVQEISDRIIQHSGSGRLLIMMEHTDNRDWIKEVKKQLEEKLPGDSEIITSPLSSTSAVHMGPGTWGVAVTRI